jgi:homoserine O-acetyltransferase
VERFDANSYMVLSLAMDRFSLGATLEELKASLRPARCDWLVLSFSSDWLFPPDQSRDIVNALIANNASVSYANIQSACGHDAFLLPDDFASYGEMVRAFLKNEPAGGNQVMPRADECDAPDRISIFHRQRVDYDRIVELIPEQASVLDLGCGSGRLLCRLQENGLRHVTGVELDEREVLDCLRRGLHVIQADLNHGLRSFGDQQFDCVVLSQTLQAVLDVESVIADMLRVGRVGIVSFPNLAFRQLRRILAEEGRAPRAYGWLRDKWYNTPDIRFLSIADFEEFCAEQGIKILRRIALDTEQGIEVQEDANLNADLAIFVLGRKSG